MQDFFHPTLRAKIRSCLLRAFSEHVQGSCWYQYLECSKPKLLRCCILLFTVYQWPVYQNIPRRNHYNVFKFILPSLKLTLHLKTDGWNTSFLLGNPIFRFYVSFRECMFHFHGMWNYHSNVFLPCPVKAKKKSKAKKKQILAMANGSTETTFNYTPWN